MPGNDEEIGAGSRRSRPGRGRPGTRLPSILWGTQCAGSLSLSGRMVVVSTGRSEIEPGSLPRPASSSKSEPEDLAEDLDLVLRSARGDQGAFALIYARHQTLVFQVASRLLLNPADGADLTQEAFLKAWEQIPTLREPERFRSWLLRIVVNTALNWRTRRARERMVLRRLAEPGNSPAAFEPALRKESRDQVARALAKLSKKLRAAVVLRYVAGLPYLEVAKVMGCGEPTARTRVSRGLAELGTLLQDVTDEGL